MAFAQIGPGCDLWPNGNWQACCDIHDAAFMRGGSLGDWWSANWNLFTCVWQFSPMNAVLMFIGVTLGSALVWRFGGGASLFQKLTGKPYGTEPKEPPK